VTVSNNLQFLLDRFYTLDTREQLLAYRACRDYLSARVGETKRDRVIAERAGAIEALEAVAKHLKLPPGRAPTPTEFDEAARALGLDWNRSRVTRAWGRWRFAKSAFLGEPMSESSEQRDQRVAPRRRRRRHEGHLEGVQLWLKTKPHSFSIDSYNAWAKDYNERANGTPLVVTRGNSVSVALGLTWRDAVRLAKGEITHAQGRPMGKRPRPQFSRGPYDFVSWRDLIEKFAKDGYALGKVLSSPGFPQAALVIGRARLWIRQDVEAFRNGRPFPDRDPKEIRALYLTRKEVAALTGFVVDSVSRGRRGLPRAAVYVGSVQLWLRSEVEPWLKEHGAP
jgi:hypothetical protein